MFTELAIGATLAGLDAWNKHRQGQLARQHERSLMEQQIELANTAHQREVADLRAAGLNPILSMTGGNGAESPAAVTVQPQDNTKNMMSAKDVIALENQTVAAQAQKTAAETQAWQIYDAKDMGRAGFDVLGFGAGGKMERVQTIRVNKVTGECFTLDGKKVKVFDTPDVNAAANVPVSPPVVHDLGKHVIPVSMSEAMSKAYDPKFRNPRAFR